MNPFSVPPIFISGIAFFVGFFHLLLYLRRPQERYRFAFAVTCVSLGFYDLFCAGLYSAPDVETGASWQRLQLIALSVSSASLLWFVADYTGKIGGKLLYGATLFYAFAAAGQIVPANPWVWRTDLPLVKEIALPFGLEIVYREVTPGLMVNIQSLAGLFLFALILGAGVAQRRSGEAERADPLLKAMGILFLTVINDTAVSEGIYAFVYLLEYGYLAVVLMMTYALSNDLFQSVRTGAELRASQERYRRLVTSSPDAIAILQRDRFIYANPAFTEMLGYKVESPSDGFHYRKIVDPSALKEVERGYREYLSNEPQTQNFQIKLVAQNGDRFPCEMKAVRIEYQNEPAELVILRNVSERVGAEEERRRLEAQLLQSQKMDSIGRLAGGIAHDFNNHLMVIQGMAELALDDLEDSDPVVESFEEIDKAARKAAQLTSQLLSFSRRDVLRIEPISLNDLIEGMSRMLRRLLGAGIEVAIDLDPKCGAVLADANRIEQVILNLAINAQHAMPEGGRLEIRAYPGGAAGQTVVLEVKDNGQGMDESTRERIFEPFFTTKEVGKGAGLGLATAYGIIQQHNGTIEVESEPGNGARFRLEFPTVEGGAPAQPSASPQPAGAGGRETVFIAEDDEAVRRSAARALAKRGYRVLEASDGVEALEAIRAAEEPIELLLTDVVMPRMGGIKLCEELRKENPGLKAIFMSGFAGEPAEGEDALGGEVRFLQKPFSIQTLTTAVREALDE